MVSVSVCVDVRTYSCNPPTNDRRHPFSFSSPPNHHTITITGRRQPFQSFPTTPPHLHFHFYLSTTILVIRHTSRCKQTSPRSSAPAPSPPSSPGRRVIDDDPVCSRWEGRGGGRACVLLTHMVDWILGMHVSMVDVSSGQAGVCELHVMWVPPASMVDCRCPCVCEAALCVCVCVCLSTHPCMHDRSLTRP